MIKEHLIAYSLCAVQVYYATTVLAYGTRL